MIRHQLNEFLRRIGGHIGYGVVPSERGKGYGKKMFKKSLNTATSLGLEKILVTCDEDNSPSRKIIEGAGSVFEGTADQGPNLPKTLLYWVTPDLMSKIEFDEDPSPSDIDFLTKKINEETTEFGEAYPFGLFIKDDKNNIIAGANGFVIYGTIYTDQLWVKKRI